MPCLRLHFIMCFISIHFILYYIQCLSKQLAKINNSSLTTTHSARNLGFIFDEHLTFSDQISSVSRSCYYHIRQLCCIRPYLDTKTASTIAGFPGLFTDTSEHICFYSVVFLLCCLLFSTVFVSCCRLI